MSREWKHYTDREARFIARAVRLRGRLTNKALAERLGRSESAIDNQIIRLRERGVLEWTRRGSNG